MPDQNHWPKNWEEMSLDTRFFFGFHAGMMVLILAHFAFGLGFHSELVSVCCVAAIWLVCSVQNRRKRNWHWPGIKFRDAVGTVIGAALILFFFGAGVAGSKISNPNIFPFLAAGGNFLVFHVLTTLKVAQPTQSDFLRHCGDNKPDEPASLPRIPKHNVPIWKRTVATAFSVYFFAVWVAGVTFFWTFNSALGSGSKEPTATQTQPLSSHGHTVYIRPDQKRRVEFLEHCFIIGIPSVFVIGGLLHFVLRVRVFSDSSGISNGRKVVEKDQY